ncbi:MAG: hypothetical protein WBM00_04485, partial [Solirubrobacterales bacterium]
VRITQGRSRSGKRCSDIDQMIFAVARRIGSIAMLDGCRQYPALVDVADVTRSQTGKTPFIEAPGASFPGVCV